MNPRFYESLIRIPHPYDLLFIGSLTFTLLIFFIQITSALGRESRETTLRNARKKIEALAHQVAFKIYF